MNGREDKSIGIDTHIVGRNFKKFCALFQKKGNLHI
jgi:hypothetical protein